MSRRLYPHNKICYWYAYELKEICMIFSSTGLHEQTIREWVNDKGLTIIDRGKPALIYGNDLIQFLKRHNSKSKCKTAFGEMFCMKCRDSKALLRKRVVCVKKGNKLDLEGRCSDCETTMHKSYKLADFSKIRRVFTLVDVLELYDPAIRTVKTHIHTAKTCYLSESKQGNLFI